jgi:hypothetical protein
MGFLLAPLHMFLTGDTRICGFLSYCSLRQIVSLPSIICSLVQTHPVWSNFPRISRSNFLSMQPFPVFRCFREVSGGPSACVQGEHDPLVSGLDNREGITTPDNELCCLSSLSFFKASSSFWTGSAFSLIPHKNISSTAWLLSCTSRKHLRSFYPVAYQPKSKGLHASAIKPNLNHLSLALLQAPVFYAIHAEESAGRAPLFTVPLHS